MAMHQEMGGSASRSRVWVPIIQKAKNKGDKDEIMDYVLAHLDRYEGDLCYVEHPEHGSFNVHKDHVQQFDASHAKDQQDVASMNNLDAGPLLDVLRRRYHEDKIYTWTGKILISINPYFIIPGIYDMPSIRNDIDSGGEAFREDPHVFTVAERAYCDLIASATRRNQSLIVSGESGAGKTEACKRVMNMLAEISKMVAAKNTTGGGNLSNSSIEAKVLGCNPFLEAFGNAKTSRNDNSSRFGKFLKIQYKNGMITGAYMKQYLLEKSRVINPGPGERSYHIFYQLAAGCSEELKEQLKIMPLDQYTYLNRSGCYHVDNMDDEKEFRDVQESFRTVGIDESMQLDIFRVVSSILHLGNLEFGEEESIGGNMIATIQNEEQVNVVAELIGCSDLQMNLLQRQVRAGGGARRRSVTIVKLSKHQASEASDALAKHLYGNLFAFLVTKVNSLLATGGHSDRFIGILDIFGFEIFEVNSFEQLCINYTNEKLQNLFNHHVFTLEEEQYKSEGVDFSSVAIRDNTDCVRLIESKPMGILVQLDQICRVGRASTDLNFLEKLDRSWDQKTQKNPKFSGCLDYYRKPRVRREDRGTDKIFTVVHFAGPVNYNVTGFLEKNKDSLHGDLEFMCEGSDSSFVAQLFSKNSSQKSGDSRATRGPPKRRMTKMPATIAIKFKDQLHLLNNELLKTDPHYIRCIKPNPRKAVHMYTADMVLRQLIYAGVLETVRIRREGYPFRKQFDEFWDLCKSEGFDTLATIDPDLSSKEATRIMLTNVFDLREDLPNGLQNCWQLGHSKVFLKDAAWEYLLDFKRERISVEIQTWWRMTRQRYLFKFFRKMVSKLQTQIRGIIYRKKFALFINNALTIQCAWRRKMAYIRVDIIRVRKAEMQAAKIAREKYEREQAEAAERERKRVEALRKLHDLSSSTIGRAWLCYRARCLLRMLKVADLEFKIQFTYHVIRMQSLFRAKMKAKHFRIIMHATILVQKCVRGYLGRLHADRKQRLQQSLKAFVLMCVARHRFRRFKRCAITIASIYRMHLCRKELLAKIWACGRIRRCINAHSRNADLQAWIQDIFTLAEVGDDGFVEDLLEFHDDVEEYRFIQDMKPGAANIRLAPSYATLLHSAAKTETGSPILVEVVIEAGAVLDEIILKQGNKIYWCAKDLNGNTPLHVVATLGDRSLAIAVQLLEYSKQKLSFLNSENDLGATALDIAIENALSASSTSSSSFLSMIKWMFSMGAKSYFYGDQNEVNKLLNDLDMGRRRAQEAADLRERARAEADRLRLQGNQAYQLELIRASEETRKKNEEKERKEAEEALRREVEREMRAEREAAIAEKLEREVSGVILFCF